MNEAELNRILGVNSLLFCHKIKDGQGRLLPFDFFGIFANKAIYCESKMLKTPKAFNFTRLEDHQIGSLLQIANTPLAKEGHALPLFLIGVDFGRGDKRVFVFRDMEYIAKRKLERRSITKKEFLSRKNYILIRKNQIDYQEIISMDMSLEYQEG